ncbi:MAG TPA: hypothetical protein VGQ91_17395 [Ideonella sp.]|jgi:hypothetical protein|nr:hypothetical protein [Ideonella sp.]
MNANTTTPFTTEAGTALVPLYVSGVFREAPTSLRAQLIECLMRPMGALGLVAVANGVFAALRQRHGWHHLQVTLDDATRITGDQILELAAYLQQTAPEVFGQVGDLVSRQPALAGSLSAVLLLHVLHRTMRRR